MTSGFGLRAARSRRPRSGPAFGRVAAACAVVALASAPTLALALAGPTAPPAATADEQLAESRVRLESAEARLVALERERAEIEADHATLSEAQLSLARELEVALKDTRQFAVEAYVAGGPGASAGEVLAAPDVGESLWRAAVLAGQTDHGLERAAASRDLLGRADSAVRQIALRSDQNRRKVEAATLERFFATVANKQAEQRVASERATPLVVNTALTGDAMADAWARLRQCEASGNYRAVSPSGLYRGAYQFDQRTWETVGGTGDPIDASPAEQDLRAQILYDRRGRQPWPVCGRFLP